MNILFGAARDDERGGVYLASGGAQEVLCTVGALVAVAGIVVGATRLMSLLIDVWRPWL